MARRSTRGLPCALFLRLAVALEGERHTVIVTPEGATQSGTQHSWPTRAERDMDVWMASNVKVRASPHRSVFNVLPAQQVALGFVSRTISMPCSAVSIC